MPIRFKKMYVTSNYSMEEIFKDDEIMLQAIKRRFQEVHFTGYKEATKMEYEQKGLDDKPFKIWEKTANGKRVREEEEEEKLENKRVREVGMTCGNRHCVLMNAHIPACVKYVPDSFFQ